VTLPMAPLPTVQPLLALEDIPALQAEVRALARERDAVILAHNYQVPEVQDVADYVGDSLGLSQQAARAGASVIAFCGVHFMAETASILCPDKTVLIPDLDAGARWPTRSRRTSCEPGRAATRARSRSCTSTRPPRSRR
jgi:quinolinate synthase